MIAFRFIRALICLCSVGLLAMCARPTASTSSIAPPTPTSMPVASPSALALPTNVPTWYASLTPYPTDPPTRTFIPLPTENAATAAVENTAHVFEEQTRIPPTPAVPLAEAIKQLGPHTILYNTPNNFLTLYDLDTGMSVWITAPAPTHKCHTADDGAKQNGTWSPHGDFIEVRCEYVTHGGDAITSSLLSIKTGQFHPLTALPPMYQPEGEEGIISWSMTTPLFFFWSSEPSGDFITGSIGNAETGALTIVSGTLQLQWSPKNESFAYIHTDDQNQQRNLYVHDVNGTERLLFSDPSRYWFNWSPDGTSIIVTQRYDEAQPKTRRIDVVTGHITELAAMDQIIIWAPDSREYLAQGIHSDESKTNWEIHAADGTLKRILPASYLEPAWMPDSKHIIAITGQHNFGEKLVLADINGNERLFTQSSGFALIPPAISPDGSRIAISTGDTLLVFDTQGHQRAAIPMYGEYGFYGWRPK